MEEYKEEIIDKTLSILIDKFNVRYNDYKDLRSAIFLELNVNADTMKLIEDLFGEYKSGTRYETPPLTASEDYKNKTIDELLKIEYKGILLVPQIIKYAAKTIFSEYFR